MSTAVARVSFDDSLGMRAAIEQAKKSLAEGGIPIGSALVTQESGGELKLIAASHNKRMQKGSPILHGETATLEQAGRLKASVYRKSTIVSLPSLPQKIGPKSLLIQVHDAQVSVPTSI